VEGLRVLSSEKVIHGNGHDYLGKFLGVLDSKEYKRRVENEMNGVNALNMGGYVSAPILLKHEKTSRRAILISGVSSGLGESFFRRAVIDESLDIFCLSRNFLPYQEKFAKERNNIFLVQIDLANIDKLSKILKKLAVCLSGYKKITFINNAGSIAPVDHIGKLDAGEIISSVAVNYTSPMLLVNMLAGLEEVYLDLINITTGAARAPVEGWSVYSSSKAAAFMFFEVLTAQCERNHKGRVEQIDPGVVNTKMQSYIRGITADKFPRVSEFIRLGDFGKLANPDSIAFKIFDEYIK
jgi:benzil reductase ((S)-benzoin forming)